MNWIMLLLRVEGSNVDKFLILSESGEIESVDGQLIKSIPSQTEQDFINYGMDDLSVVNFKTKFKQKQYVQDQYQELGDGRIFSHTVNFDKYIINKIEIQ